MGFFDNLAETAFKKGADGSDIYYPSGIIGKGRVVVDAERRKKLFNYHKRTYKYVIPLASLYGLVVGFGGMTLGHLVFIGIVLTLLLARQRYLIKGLPVYGEKLKLSEAAAVGAKAVHPAFLLIFGTSSLLLIAAGATLPIVSGLPAKEVLRPMLGIASMGLLGLALSIYLYRVRKSNSIQPTQKPRG